MCLIVSIRAYLDFQDLVVVVVGVGGGGCSLGPKQQLTVQRVSMGLIDRRKTAKNLVASRKNWKILTVSRK